ncbi:MAG: hypothetical protein M1365_11685 [Actinobacteria bacterium]|nr:hypothetical protein [Actinomycetota bacterium]
MEIQDFEIQPKKYDKGKNSVYVNIIVCGIFEIRGYVVRFTETQYSHGSAVWVVSPPSVRMRNKRYFWIVRLKDKELWKQLQELIIEKVKEYTSSV